jgi:hypothetical protein
MEKKLITEIKRIKYLMVINEGGGAWDTVAIGLKRLLKRGDPLFTEIGSLSTKLANKTISDTEFLKRISSLSLSLDGDIFKRYVEIVVSEFEDLPRSQLSQIFREVKAGNMEKSAAQDIARQIGTVNETDNMLVKYIDELPVTKVASNNPLPSSILPGLQNLNPDDIINKLRSEFAGNAKAQKAINKAESDIQKYIPKNVQEVETILNSQRKLIQDALGTKTNWEQIKGWMLKNWATKAMSSFFFVLAASFVFKLAMEGMGITGLTPFRFILDGLGLDEFLDNWCDEGHTWACKGSEAVKTGKRKREDGENDKPVKNDPVKNKPKSNPNRRVG